MRMNFVVSWIVGLAFATGCSGSSMPGAANTDGGTPPSSGTALDPDTAPAASIDRFSDGFATLFKRSAPAFDPTNVSKVVPPPNAPINLDNFLVHSLGPKGEKVTYYSLDILPPTAGKVYRLVHGNGTAVAGQLPIFNAVPGDKGYNDFDVVVEVTMPDGYVANTITNEKAVANAIAKGAAAKTTTQMVNYALVPKGSTAALKFLGNTVTGFRGWFNDQVASYLQFDTTLLALADAKVPTEDIFVTFKNDKDPSGGFATETGSNQTHNVVGSLPGQDGYSSYWDHSVDNLAAFTNVKDLATASDAANVKAKIPVIVNCPIVQ